MTNFGFERTGKEELTLEQEVDNFHDISIDNRSAMVKVGIPLYKKLKDLENPKAEEVKRSLLYLKKVLEESDAGEEAARLSTISEIKNAID